MSAFRWKMHDQGGLGSLFYGRWGDYRISLSPRSRDLQALWYRPQNGPRRGTYVLVDDYATTQDACDAAVAHYKARHGAHYHD